MGSSSISQPDTRDTPLVHPEFASGQYTPLTMDAALDFSSASSVAPGGSDAGVSGQRAVSAKDTECQGLREQSAAARRAVVRARIALAAASDPETSIIWRAQQRLLAEGHVPRDARYSPRRFSASPQPGDPQMLRMELDRVLSLARTLERQVAAGQAGGAWTATAKAAPPVLDAFVARALETMAEDQARGRQPSAGAPPVEPFIPIDGYVGNPVMNRHAMEGANPLPTSEPPIPVYDKDFEREWENDEPTGPVATVDPMRASVPSWERKAAARPMILDVILPLIAVAIVLLVVLSWIG